MKKTALTYRRITATVLIPAVLLSALLFSCMRTPRQAVSPTAHSLDSLFSTIFPHSHEPGAVIAVYRGDSLLYAGSFGASDMESRKAITDSTVLNIASASKTYVAAGLLKLCEQNRLSLNDKLTKFFPTFNKDIFDGITLQHVLTHTSGLPDLRPRNENQWLEYTSCHTTPFSDNTDYQLYGRENELIRYFETIRSVKNAPGTVFDYQDAPYLLLPGIIEQVTDSTFEQWMQCNIFAPAGLSETYFFDPEDQNTHMAHAYRLSQGKWQEFDYGESPFFLTRADHGICTSGRDFAKWIKALYDGRIISKKSLATANTAHVPTQKLNIDYGLGLYVQDIETMPYKVFHSTANGGFAIFEAVFPRQNISYHIFANRPDWNRLETSLKVDSILRHNNWIKKRQPAKQ